MSCFKISWLLVVFLTKGIASKDDFNENSPDITTTEHEDLQYKNIEDILKLDEDDCGKEVCSEDSGLVQNRIGTDDVEQEEEESSSTIWIIIGIVLVAFVCLGVFNHIIIPRCCIAKKGQKDGKGIQMSALKAEENKKRESVGNHNGAFEDVPLNAVEKDSNIIETIENEKSIIEVSSALEVITEPKTEFTIDNEEYTKTPRNSMSKEKENGQVTFNNDPKKDTMPNIEDDVIVKTKVEDTEIAESLAKEEISERVPEIENSFANFTSTTQGGAKEAFRSRKKSTMSIEIEDGNIKNFVEGPSAERISVITETSQE